MAKAQPLFPGHYQPRLPADLGFYDLRLPEPRAAQAELAREHGIEGFCYWYYWFAGKQLLERPFAEVLHTGEPDYPFCLAWANQSWTGTWHGAPERMLIEQNYPGKKDEEDHFKLVLNAFADERYLRIDGKPIFVVFAPWDLPDPRSFTDHWRELAVKAGLKGLHLVGHGLPSWKPNKDGFDASVLSNLTRIFRVTNRATRSMLDKVSKLVMRSDIRDLRRIALSRPKVYQYAEAIKHATPTLDRSGNQYPVVIPSWDNTPRSGNRGVVLHESTPELFRNHLKTAISQVIHRDLDRRLIFIKSWNEWAEGNYLEPDSRYGKAYLEVIRDEIIRA